MKYISRYRNESTYENQRSLMENLDNNWQLKNQKLLFENLLMNKYLLKSYASISRKSMSKFNCKTD